MKIRTDFVTNSSSSCFCVSLTLSFDNGEKLVCGDMDSIGEEYNDCKNEPREDIQSSCGGVMFSKIVESRKNISELQSILSSCFPKAKLSVLKNATELTGADLSISGCASGEESWRITMYRLLGVDDVALTKDSIESNVARLKDAGMNAYEEEGLERIVLYEDMGLGGAFKDKAKKYGITYNEDNLSKTICCSMQENGKIKVQVYPGESFEKDRPMLGTTWNELGVITKILRFEMSVDKVPDAENAIREWVSKKNYSCDLSQDDNLVSIFKKLGFKYDFSLDDNGSAFILETGKFDCKNLCVPLSEFLQVISSFCYGALIIVESQKMNEPMAIKMSLVTGFSANGSRDYAEIEIGEATDEDFEEGYPW